MPTKQFTPNMYYINSITSTYQKLQEKLSPSDGSLNGTLMVFTLHAGPEQNPQLGISGSWSLSNAWEELSHT